jgi:hypothetical protein
MYFIFILIEHRRRPVPQISEAEARARHVPLDTRTVTLLYEGAVIVQGGAWCIPSLPYDLLVVRESSLVGHESLSFDKCKLWHS